MKRSLRWAALFLPLGLMSSGCNENGGTRTSGARTTERTTTTTTTTTAPAPPRDQSAKTRVDVGADRPNAPAGPVDGRDHVGVDVAPNGGVDVEVQGEPIRDRIRERRAARDADLPR
ncbi:MAG TPA: hypothetical protein VNH11_25575 [Pirellulales bacterium]|nr:hypothetical protein [Pirellulales bacterium]